MKQYIDKSALVAEIEKWMTLLTKEKNQEGASKIDKLSLGGRIAELQEVKVFLDTLEVKEIDLKEKHELTWEDVAWITNLVIRKCKDESTLTAKDIYKDVLKQFKAQKGELSYDKRRRNNQCRT